MTINDIHLNDEVGGTRVVFILAYPNKELSKVFNFVGIDPKGTYRLFRHDSSGELYSTDMEGSNLKDLILEVLELMKEEIKLKHKPFTYGQG